MNEVKSKRRQLLAGLGLGYFVNSAQELSLPQLFPVIQKTFSPGLPDSAITTIDSVRVLIQTALTPVWGFLADRYSRKWVLVVGTGLWGGLAIFCGLSHTYWQLLIAWVISLLGLGALVPAGFSMIADVYAPSERGSAIGILNALGMAGIIAFGLLCNPFLSFFGANGWRIMFFGVAGLSILAGIFLAVFIQEPVRGAAEPELSGLTAELAASKFRFRLADILEVLRTKTIWVAFVQGFFMLSSLYILLRLFTLWLVKERLFKEENAPVVFGVVVIALAAGSILGGLVSDWADQRWPRHGRPAISQVALCLIIPSLFILIKFAQSTAAIIAVASFMAVFLEWTRRCTIQPIIQNVTRPELRGTALALAEFFTGGFASFMVMYFGKYADAHGLSSAFMLGSGGNAVMALVVASLYYPVYPKDLARLRALMQERRELISSQN